MSITAGTLRLFAWSRRDAEQPEAHAFDDRAGFVHRSLCDAERWTVRRIPATDETPRCTLCAAIVRGAAHRALLELAPPVRSDLEPLLTAPACARCDAPAIDHEELAGGCPSRDTWYAPLSASETELRAAWGDR